MRRPPPRSAPIWRRPPLPAWLTATSRRPPLSAWFATTAHRPPLSSSSRHLTRFGTIWRRLAWFAAIWLLSVTALGILAYIIRLLF